MNKWLFLSDGLSIYNIQKIKSMIIRERVIEKKANLHAEFHDSKCGHEHGVFLVCDKPTQIVEKLLYLVVEFLGDKDSTVFNVDLQVRIIERQAQQQQGELQQ